jgi:hypothetical protein
LISVDLLCRRVNTRKGMIIVLREQAMAKGAQHHARTTDIAN